MQNAPQNSLAIGQGFSHVTIGATTYMRVVTQCGPVEQAYLIPLEHAEVYLDNYVEQFKTAVAAARRSLSGLVVASAAPSFPDRPR